LPGIQDSPAKVPLEISASGGRSPSAAIACDHSEYELSPLHQLKHGFSPAVAVAASPGAQTRRPTELADDRDRPYNVGGYWTSGIIPKRYMETQFARKASKVGAGRNLTHQNYASMPAGCSKTHESAAWNSRRRSLPASVGSNSA